MAKKVYGVIGMMEWHALIPIGKSSLNVKFTGGTLTGYGVTPAKYTTSDAVIQKMIENSEHFKNGKIKLLRVFETAESKEVPVIESKNDDITSIDDKELEMVEVTSLDDAKEYLKDKFNVSWNKLKSKSAIIETAQTHGVRFLFK